MSADVARDHGGDGGGDDRPPPHQIGCRDQFGQQAIRFEWSDKGTLMPLGDHAAHWVNLLGEIVWEFLMHFRSWHNIPEERKAGVMGKIGGQYGKLATLSIGLLTLTTGLTTWKASDPDVPRTSQWQIGMHRLPFGLILRTLPVCSKCSKPGKEHGHMSAGIPMESSATREYPALIQTYFDTHTVSGVFLRDKERLLYEEMLTLQGLGTYTDDQIMAIVRRGKQLGNILSVGRVLAGRGRDVLVSPEPRCMHTADVDELKRINRQLKKQMDMIMKVVRSDDKMSQLLMQLQS
ncbi:hypothetical protein Tco_1061715 [Tanacetum coccineum]